MLQKTFALAWITFGKFEVNNDSYDSPYIVVQRVVDWGTVEAMMSLHFTIKDPGEIAKKVTEKKCLNDELVDIWQCSLSLSDNIRYINKSKHLRLKGILWCLIIGLINTCGEEWYYSDFQVYVDETDLKNVTKLMTVNGSSDIRSRSLKNIFDQWTCFKKLIFLS